MDCMNVSVTFQEGPSFILLIDTFKDDQMGQACVQGGMSLSGISNINTWHLSFMPMIAVTDKFNNT